jgi:formylglycine-generating enzyme required for sulfatase activity
MGTAPVTVSQFTAFAVETNYQTDAERSGSSMAWENGRFSPKAGVSWRRPGFEQSKDDPVVLVSWNDAAEFCNWLSKKDGRPIGLPTSAEWEYACRAGTTTNYVWGDDPDKGAGWANCADATLDAAFPGPDRFSWADKYQFTSPVDTFRPNAFGLYDMAGNVKQWCNDFAGPLPPHDAVDPAGPLDGKVRILRGAAWSSTVHSSRIVPRFAMVADLADPSVGFRVVVPSDK